MRRQAAGDRRALLTLALAAPLLALGCGPARPEHTTIASIDGREYRVLGSAEIAISGEQRLLRVDFEPRAFADREASRKEARGLLLPLQNSLVRRRHVLIVANAPRSDPWSDEREQLAFLFERIDKKWEIVAEETPALALARLE